MSNEGRIENYQNYYDLIRSVTYIIPFFHDNFGLRSSDKRR